MGCSCLRSHNYRDDPSMQLVCVNDQFGGYAEDFNFVDEKQMEDLPHRHIGAIICVGPGVIQYSTGTLVSRNLILTCGHGLYNKQYKVFYDRINFYPRLNGKISESKWYKIQNFAVPEEYQNTQCPQTKEFDFALLKLEEPIDETDFMPISSDAIEIDNQEQIFFYGYPVSKYSKKDGKPRESKQYGHKKSGCLLDDQKPGKNLIRHKIPSEAGQSGAVVLKKNQQGQNIIFAIHVGSTTDKLEDYRQFHPELQKINLAKIIDKKMIQRLTELAHKLKGQMFRLTNDKTLKEQNSILQIFPHQIKVKSSNMQSMNSSINDFLPQISEKYLESKVQGQISASEVFFTIHNNPEIQNQGDKANEIMLSKISQKSKELLSSSLSFQKEKKYDEEIKCYNQILKINPQLPKINNKIGMALLNSKQYQKAIAHFQSEIQIYPNNSKAHNNLGTTLIGLEKFKQATIHLKKAIQINPNYSETHSNLGYALAHLGPPQIKQAITTLEKAIQLKKGNVLAYKNLGYALYKDKKYDKSIWYYHTAIDRNNEVRDAYEHLTRILQNECKNAQYIKKSLQFLDKVAKTFPENQRAKNTVLILRQELKKLQQ